MTHAQISLPGFDLDEPGTLMFTPQQALQGHSLNQCAISLRTPANRAAFRQDPVAYMARRGLDAQTQDQVLRRDWVALQRAGGHLQAILKIAATMGDSLWHIGAHHLSLSAEQLIAMCPRVVHGLPEELTWHA